MLNLAASDIVCSYFSSCGQADKWAGMAGWSPNNRKDQLTEVVEEWNGSDKRISGEMK